MNTTACNRFGVKTTHGAYSSGTVIIVTMTSWAPCSLELGQAGISV